MLEQTWLIVTADHGESFGEHPGMFGHGASLYETEVHVPLLIIPPGAGRPSRVREAISLCATWRRPSSISLGRRPAPPFPGESLARFWKPPIRLRRSRPVRCTGGARRGGPARPGNARNYWGNQVARRAGGRQGTRVVVYPPRRETLASNFTTGADPNEQRNLADDPSARATLERMRATLSRG